MYQHTIYQRLDKKLTSKKVKAKKADQPFHDRFLANLGDIQFLFNELYGSTGEGTKSFDKLLDVLIDAYLKRPAPMKARDAVKAAQGDWFLSNKLSGMSLYVDRFCGKLKDLSGKLDYFNRLGVNLLHLMPIFESPEGESDGGYAVSDFRKVDKRFGTLKDLQAVQSQLAKKDMYLMLDIVLNHTSQHHDWAKKAKAGNKVYQGYYYMFPDRVMPDQFEQTMPEIFPEAAPGNFTYVPECQQWVMSVFHNYQWDLNYQNPAVFREMMANVLFFANLGVDILRIDAPAFLWKQPGTTCQNLPQAHTILQLIKHGVQVVAPGMAILGEAIVAPKEIMKYFGTGHMTARECDFAYNATHMALQWDMLATADTRIMLAAQQDVLQKPRGTSWINYTRCHDDIGLAYEDDTIVSAGFSPWEHRKFLKDYYSGVYADSTATGALFGVNPKTGDARISGTLASLCGLEAALETGKPSDIDLSIQKILLMQAHSFFLGGLPMLFYGDEVGYTNDYSYLNDPGKSYDNRWMHRPQINWAKNKRAEIEGTIENKVFIGTRRLLSLRASLSAVADLKNIYWIDTLDKRVAGYVRKKGSQQIYCLFNFSRDEVSFPLPAIAEGTKTNYCDHWTGKSYSTTNPVITLEPYGFQILT